MKESRASCDQVEDFFGKSHDQAAAKRQKSLGTLGRVVALEREANLHNAPTQQDETDGTDQGKDEGGEVVHHPQRIAGGKSRGGETAGAQHCRHVDRKPIPSFSAERQGVCGLAAFFAVFRGNKFTQRFLQKHSSSSKCIVMG